MYILPKKYNHLLITQHWKDFRKGDLIWANHMHGFFYCDPYDQKNCFRPGEPLPQECAINLENTIWLLRAPTKKTLYKFLHYQVGNADGTCSNISLSTYSKDTRLDHVTWTDTDSTLFLAMAYKKEIIYIDNINNVHFR